MTLTNNLANSRLKYDRGCKMTTSEQHFGYLLSESQKPPAGLTAFHISERLTAVQAYRPELALLPARQKLEQSVGI